jgi:hypothetical protein
MISDFLAEVVWGPTTSSLMTFSLRQLGIIVKTGTLSIMTFGMTPLSITIKKFESEFHSFLIENVIKITN